MTKRFVCIKQVDITDCGAACLATIAHHYNLKLPISRIREYAMTDRWGTNVLGMIQAAEQLGFDATGVKGNSDALSDIPLPAIAHVVLENRLHHYVVIFEVTKTKIVLADPAKGPRTLDIEPFLKIWSGVLILLKPNSRFIEGNFTESNFKRISNLVKPHPALIVASLISALVYTALGLATALYVQSLLDDVFPHSDQHLLNTLSVAMIVILLFRVLFSWIRQLMLLLLSQRIDSKLILGYYKHILKLPQSFFDSRRVGEIISRVNDAIKIRVAISSASLTIVVDSMILIFSFALMLTFSWKLALAMFVVLPLFLVMFFALNDRIRRTQLEIMEKAAELQAHLVSSINGIATIKASQAETLNNVETENIFEQTLGAVKRAGIQGIINATGSEAISGLALIVLLWLGGAYVLQNHLSTGELMSFYTLVGFVTGPASRLLGVNQIIQDGLIAADRLYEILAMDTEESIHQGTGDLGQIAHSAIHFKDVSFRYGTRSLALDHVSFAVPVGRTTALVGESGSGKSTIAKLLQGLYQPTEGSICFGGIDMQDISIRSLRAYCGVVPQEVELFEGTIVSNVAYGEATPNEERVREACKLSGAEQFIENLPYGWNTALGEHGANLSGGERQRLALSRALYRKPKLLILDEATSSLDSESERIIQGALARLRMAGVTIVIISHRLSSVVCADEIIVLDKGRIVEQGTHLELVRQGGKYFSLWNNQSSTLVGSNV